MLNLNEIERLHKIVTNEIQAQSIGEFYNARDALACDYIPALVSVVRRICDSLEGVDLDAVDERALVSQIESLQLGYKVISTDLDAATEALLVIDLDDIRVAGEAIWEAVPRYVEQLENNLETARQHIAELKTEQKFICNALYAAAIPSASEDGYGENIMRMESLLERIKKDRQQIADNRQRTADLDTLEAMLTDFWWMISSSPRPDSKGIIIVIRDKFRDNHRRIAELEPLLDCRVGKLLLSNRFFVVVADEEPYFNQVYDMIRKHEIAKGEWTKEDQQLYDAHIQPIEFTKEEPKNDAQII